MKETNIYIWDGRSPTPENEVTSRVISAIKGKNTKPELILRKALWNIGLRGYRLHWKKVAGRPDIAFPVKKIAIFVNGGFWHRCPYCPAGNPEIKYTFLEGEIQEEYGERQGENSTLGKGPLVNNYNMGMPSEERRN